VKLKDLVTNEETVGFQFDAEDRDKAIRYALATKPSVEADPEDIVVGSYRLYLPQVHQVGTEFEAVETEIIERDEWLIWSEEDQVWAIYPPKLFVKYFEEVHDEPVA